MNGDDISRLLSGLMQNPDALKGLMSSLGAGSSQQSASSESGSSDNGIQNALAALKNTDDHRITLLNALRPYLSPQKSGGIDRAIRVLQLAKLSELMRNERD